MRKRILSFQVFFLGLIFILILNNDSFYKEYYQDNNESLRQVRKMYMQITSNIIYQDMASLVSSLQGIVEFQETGITLVKGKEQALRDIMSDLVYNAANNPSIDIKEAACWMIISLAPQMGVIPSSARDIYSGLIDLKEQAIPKINVRAMGFDTVSAIIRAAEEKDSVFILEVAASELGYIFDGLAAEHTAVALGTAIIKGYMGPMFFSGDHCQVKRALYDEDSEAAFAVTQQTIRKELEAGHYSVDLDTSTLASSVSEGLLDKPELALSEEERKLFREAQRPNFEGAVRLTIYTRLLEAVLGLKEKGIQVALNGEVGEVGSGYIHPQELKQFLIGYGSTLEEFKNLSSEDKLKWIQEEYGFFEFTEHEKELIINQIDIIDFFGLGGMSAGIGTAHGGQKVRGEPWNRVEERVVDLELVARCRQICESYNLAGPIVHGASSLPGDELAEVTMSGAVAAHLATYLHDIVLSHPAFPTDIILELFKLIRANDESLYNKKVEIIDKEMTEQTGQMQYKNVTMGTIIEEIEGNIKAGIELTDEQRKQVAWIAHQARGKNTNVRAFIDLKQNMWDISLETRDELRQAVTVQVLDYMVRLNSQGTNTLIREIEFPIPPVSSIPEALKNYIVQFLSVDDI